jgi:hypothetical protein
MVTCEENGWYMAIMELPFPYRVPSPADALMAWCQATFGHDGSALGMVLGEQAFDQGAQLAPNIQWGAFHAGFNRPHSQSFARYIFFFRHPEQAAQFCLSWS